MPGRAMSRNRINIGKLRTSRDRKLIDAQSLRDSRAHRIKPEVLSREARDPTEDRKCYSLSPQRARPGRPSNSRQLTVIATVVRVMPARWRRLATPRSRGVSVICTPMLIKIHNVSCDDTVLVWELGGVAIDRSGYLRRHEFRLTRSRLDIGRTFSVTLEEASSGSGGGFEIRDAVPALPRGKWQKWADSLALAAFSREWECTHPVNIFGRWLSDPPEMQWHQSLLANDLYGGRFSFLHPTFQENYTTAALKWYDAQDELGAINPGDENPEPWFVFQSPWPEPDPNDPTLPVVPPGESLESVIQAHFHDFDLSEDPNLEADLTWIMEQGGESLKAMAFMWQHPKDFLALVDYRYEKGSKQFVDTCMGVGPLPQISRIRVWWNAQFEYDDAQNPDSHSSLGIWIHEMGHVLGLAHRKTLCNLDTIMTPGPLSPAETYSLTSLGEDDRNRIAAIYPNEPAVQGTKKQCS